MISFTNNSTKRKRKRTRKGTRRTRRTPGMLIFAGIGILVFLLGCAVWYRLTLREQQFRMEQIESVIQEKAVQHNIEANLIRAVIWKESRFNPKVVGSKGEIGLMQIMDGAVADWARLTRKKAPSKSDLFLPENNIEIGAWYLSQAGQHWDGYAGKEILQLAEYNAGRRNVEKLWKPEKKSDPILPESISFPGTQDYIKQILKKKAEYDRQFTH